MWLLEPIDLIVLGLAPFVGSLFGLWWFRKAPGFFRFIGTVCMMFCFCGGAFTFVDPQFMKQRQDHVSLASVSLLDMNAEDDGVLNRNKLAALRYLGYMQLKIVDRRKNDWTAALPWSITQTDLVVRGQTESLADSMRVLAGKLERSLVTDRLSVIVSDGSGDLSESEVHELIQRMSLQGYEVHLIVQGGKDKASALARLVSAVSSGSNVVYVSNDIELRARLDAMVENSIVNRTVATTQILPAANVIGGTSPWLFFGIWLLAVLCVHRLCKKLPKIREAMMREPT